MTVIHANFGRPPLHAPTDPDLVIMICYAREDSGEELSWREIATIVGNSRGRTISHTGAKQDYVRWKAWYRAQP
jgi:hypothetical protein